MALSLLLAVLLSAPAGAAAPSGYVVKVEGGRIFLDLGRGAGASVGRRFVVFREGAELKHPVTGESLGPVLEEIASGEIVDVQEKYSVGAVEAAKGVAAGQRVRLDPGAEAAPAAPAPAAPGAGVRESYYRSPVLDLEAVDVAAGDVDGDGAQDLVLADRKSVRAYAPRKDASEWTPLCSFEDDGTGVNFLSLEAEDLDGDGRAEIFAVSHNTFLQRVETTVLDCRGEPSAARRATFPGAVRSFPKPGGRALGVQQLASDRTFPFAAIYRLEFRDGKHGPSEERVEAKRLEWIYGFGLARARKGDVLLHYDSGDRLRLRYRKGSWSSPKKYGQTSERIRWHGRVLSFYPRFFVKEDAEGLSGLYTLHNVPRFFALGAPFGAFGSAELHFLRFNGLALEPTWKAELGGYACGLAELDDRGRPALAAALVGADGKTSVWFFDK